MALTLMPHAPKLCTTLYFVSSILDVADGKAARALDQTSKFGAVLDMVTDRSAASLEWWRSTMPSLAIGPRRRAAPCRSDGAEADCGARLPPPAPVRCSTACLLCFLAIANPSYALVFQFLIALDFASHYMHMYRCGRFDTAGYLLPSVD
jgi:CDP-diacylglycerol--inositol 3-phosphatidyltransferase